MVTPINRVAYVYLHNQDVGAQAKSNPTFTTPKKIFKKLLYVFHKTSKKNSLEL